MVVIDSDEGGSTPLGVCDMVDANVWGGGMGWRGWGDG